MPQQWLPALYTILGWAHHQVDTINELLDLDSAAFIKSAYLALLGREVNEWAGPTMPEVA